MSLGETRGIKKLALYENDTPEEVVAKFAAEHGISEKKQETLLKMLIQKMKDHHLID